MGVVSPHKLLWYLQKETRRRSNEASVRRLHPQLSDAGKTISKSILIAPGDHRLHNSGHEKERKSPRQVSLSDTSSQHSSPRSLHHQHQYPSSRTYAAETFHGEPDNYDDEVSSDAEDSDATTGGVELSELERCVLNLTHRRSQLRKQDTNAFLIAPPEYKISSEDVPFEDITPVQD